MDQVFKQNGREFAVLCSQHFKESDFDKSAFKIVLHQNVVPSIFVQRHKYVSADILFLHDHYRM